MSQVWTQLFLQACTDAFYWSQLFNTRVKSWWSGHSLRAPREEMATQLKALDLEITVNRVGGAYVNLPNPLDFVISSLSNEMPC